MCYSGIKSFTEPDHLVVEAVHVVYSNAVYDLTPPPPLPKKHSNILLSKLFNWLLHYNKVHYVH